MPQIDWRTIFCKSRGETKFTDFPAEASTLWICNSTILLPSEFSSLPAICDIKLPNCQIATTAVCHIASTVAIRQQGELILRQAGQSAMRKAQQHCANRWQ